MERGQAFVDVLDEMLDGCDSRGALPRPDLRIATPSLYALAQPPQQVRRMQPVQRAEPLPRAARPRRTLSMKQQDALDTLLGLGARLDRDFTDEELRTVFRTLALRYHPDRHVHAGEAERARLSLLFTRAHAAYELLKITTPPTLH